MSSLSQLKPQELVAKVAELVDNNADHFAVLGVPRGTDVAEIKKVFVQLARSMHPDLPAFATPEAKAQATRAFQAVTRAQMVLTDPSRRAEYLNELGVAADPESMEPNPDLARIHMHRARQLIARRDWAGAEESLRVASQLFGEDVDDACQVELGWAIFNNGAHSEAVRAEQSRDVWTAVIEARGDPASVAQAHYYMAIWCKLNGEVPKVKKHLDNCLSIDARHVEAQRELRLFERRRSSSSTKRPTGKARRPTGEHRRSGERRATGEHKVGRDTNPPGRTEVKKVPLKRRQSLLERLFGKGK